MSHIKILTGNCLDTLKSIPEKSINTCVTSPPYWGLRDYGTGEWQGGDPDCPHMRTTKISKDTSTGHKAMFEQGNVVGDAIYKKKCPECGAVRKDNQLGLEETPEKFVENLVNVFREVKRVLRDDGTVWLNLGDSYCGTGHKGDHIDPKHKDARTGQKVALNNKVQGLKSKDLVGIPWRVAFALQADGWYLRQDIIWHKPNPMPESVTDRCTKSHEYIFLLSKNAKYYYDNEAIKEKAVGERWGGNNPINMRNTKDIDNQFSGLTRERKMLYDEKNKRSVWTITPKSFKEAHFATFPIDLIEPCILAGCPENGTVLDPFGGSGTVGLASNGHNRNSVLCELNPEYVKIATDRIELEAGGMFTTVEVDD
jgi:DNA modification methylase